MQHNLQLNDAAADLVQTSLDTIALAIAELRRMNDETLVHLVPAERFDEMRAPLGTIIDARWVIEQLIFRTSVDDREYGIDTSSHPANGNRRRVRMMTDDDTVQRALSLVVAATPDGEHVERDQAGPLPCDDDCSCRGGQS